MHDTSFMALALIVSEKNDLNAKTRHLSMNHKGVGQVSNLNIGLTLSLRDVCMIQVSWLKPL